jgi:hypothetical protein
VSLTLLFLIVVLTHIANRGFFSVVQFDIRNTLYYSLIFFFLPLFVRDRQDLLGLIDYVIKIVWLTFLVCLIYVFKPSLLLYGRVASTLGDPNNYGFYLNFVIAIVASYILNRVGKPLKYYWLIGIAMTLLVLTASVGNYVLLMGILLTIFLIKRRFLFVTVLTGVMAGVLYLVIEVWQFSSLVDKFQVITSGGRTVSNRLMQYEEIWNFLTTGEWYTVLFGDFSLDHYQKYECAYFNLLRNNGLIVTLVYLALHFYFVLLAYLISKRSLQQGDHLAHAQFQGLFVFLFSAAFFSFTIHPLIYRFPLNLLMFFFYAILLMAWKRPELLPPQKIS